MRSALAGWSLLAAAALPAQSVARTAVSTGFIVHTSTLQQTIPSGTALVNGSSITVSAAGESASTIVAMPPGSATFRVTSSAQGSTPAGFSNAAIVTLACPSPTAVDLQLSASVGVPMCGARVDVGNDGVPELVVNLLSGTATVGAVFGPSPLPISTSSFGFALEGSAYANVEVLLVRRLTATSTSYLAGCGPTLAVAPTDTTTLRATVTGMPPAGLAFVVVGLGTANVTLPFGGCALGLTTDWPLRLALDAAGNGHLDIGVPVTVRSFAANVQAVGLDFVSSPNAVATSDAIAVLLAR